MYVAVDTVTGFICRIFHGKPRRFLIQQPASIFPPAQFEKRCIKKTI